MSGDQEALSARVEDSIGRVALEKHLKTTEGGQALTSSQVDYMSSLVLYVGGCEKQPAKYGTVSGELTEMGKMVANRITGSPENLDYFNKACVLAAYRAGQDRNLDLIKELFGIDDGLAVLGAISGDPQPENLSDIDRRVHQLLAQAVKPIVKETSG